MKNTPASVPQTLCGRYRAVLASAWMQRAQLAGPALRADEAAFLPAALSLQHTPVHPAPRRTTWALITLVAAALAWACIGTVDIVAVAPGRIIVRDRNKLIQPLERSVVRRILVRDGDHVQAGQPLVELDPTGAQADKSSVQEQFKSAQSDTLRLGMLLQAGVHVDCADAHSRTPLMMACSGSHDAAVRLLLKNGASLMLRDTKGKSAKEHAKGDEVVELIKSSAAGQGMNTRAESHNSNGSFTSTMHAVPPLLLSSVVQASLIQQSRFSRARSSAHQLLQTIERMSALERGNGIVWSAEQLLLLDSLEQLTSGALDTSNSLFKACHPYE